MSKCELCRLHKTCRNPLQMGVGKKSAKLMVVQENPYEFENKKGIYMGGKAGRLFHAALEEVGISPDDVYFTALVKCSSPEDRLPIPDEIRTCEEYLQAEIEVINPDIIIPTGNLSLKALAGITGITKQHGRLIEKNGRKYFPIIHPNIVLKQPKYMDSFTKDMINLKGLLEGKVPENVKQYEKNYVYGETYEAVIEEIKRLISLPSGSIVTVDIETTKSNPFIPTVSASQRTQQMYPTSLHPKIVAVGLSDNPGYGFAFPLYHRETPFSGNQIGTIIKFLRVLFSLDHLEFCGHNGKFDMKWLRAQFDIPHDNFKWDTMLLHYLMITEEKGTHGLKDLAWVYTSMGGYDDTMEEVKPKGEDEGNYDLVGWDILKMYLCGDVDCTQRILKCLLPLYKENETYQWLYNELMIPAHNALMDIECTGAYVNKEWLEKLQKTYPKEIQRLIDKLHQFPEVLEIEREMDNKWSERVAIGQIPKVNRTEEQQRKFVQYKKYDPSKGGGVFNFGSTKQLQDLLFNRMGLQTVVLTDKGALSTNDESIKFMSDQHDICPLILEFRKVNHLYNNFVSTMGSMVDENSLVHGTYNIHGTVTGRLSSTEPNCQQFPRHCNDIMKFQYWNEIKSLFTSRFGDDGCIIQFDYSQLELRILAVFSQDKNLINVYRSGQDLHKATASKAFGIPFDEVSKDQRTAAKKVSFGIVYQESPMGLSIDLRAEGVDMSVEDCEDFIRRYFKEYPGVKKWIAQVKRFAKTNKYVVSKTGRIRHLQGIDSIEKTIANECIRQAVNAPIQSTGSDCTLQAIIQINKWLKETNKKSRMVITVHDSIVLDCHKDEVVEVASKVKHIMEHLAEYHPFYSFLGDVPLVSEMEIGYDYGKMYECEISDIEEKGVDGYLQEQNRKQKSYEEEQYEKYQQEGKSIPLYVEGYWKAS